jgi:hypothetical protein
MGVFGGAVLAAGYHNCSVTFVSLIPDVKTLSSQFVQELWLYYHLFQCIYCLVCPTKNIKFIIYLLNHMLEKEIDIIRGVARAFLNIHKNGTRRRSRGPRRPPFSSRAG